MTDFIKTKEQLVEKYPPFKFPEELTDLVKQRKAGVPQYKEYCICNKFYLIFIVLLFGAIMFLILNINFKIYAVIAFASCVFICLLNKNSKAADSVRKAVYLRPVLNEDELKILWEAEEQYSVAKGISLICIDNIGWRPESFFIPDDPFNLMIELYTGDLCEVECITDIEEKYSFKFPDDYFKEENPGDLKFKEVVEYVIANRGAN